MTAGPLRSPRDIDLRGTSLVEAGAGTGKTWTITALYLRLLVEQELEPRQILAVTYTEAAAADLRERIRQRLLDCQEALDGKEPKDDFLKRYIEEGDAGVIRRRVEGALQGFDQAAIHTMHAFCQRLLGEAAFECGAPFDLAILPDEQDLMQQAVDDFWRREADSWSPCLLEHLTARGANPDSLRRAVAPFVHKPYLRVDHPPAGPPLNTLEADFAAAAAAAAKAWRATDRATLESLLLGGDLNARSFSEKTVGRALDLASRILDEDLPVAAAARLVPESMEGSDLRFLGWTNIKGKVKKGRTPPSSPLFAAVDELVQARAGLQPGLHDAETGVRRALIEWLRKEMPRLKERLGVMAFDDLLTRTSEALRGPGDGPTVKAARRRYRAALIDEFQDTDPVQWDIFRRIFHDGELPLVVVGDPKQAIYSFRGADVFTYLGARIEARETRDLTINRRSDPTLLEGLNDLFGGSEPFIDPRIGYRPAEPLDPFPSRLDLTGFDPRPLRLWRIENQRRDKDTLEKQAAEATAEEIVRLLEAGRRGEAVIRIQGEKSRDLGGRDIAVLVRTGQQGRRVREALARRGVRSVQRDDESVFASEEAGELLRVLAAVADPGNARLLAGALVTRLMGIDVRALRDLRADERQWGQVTGRFREYRRLWVEKGFMLFMRRFLAGGERAPGEGLGEGILARLLAREDGARRVTNLGHLAELLHAEWRGGQLGPEGLGLYLSRKRSEERVADEALMRLESDERLVKIVTVHSSKGLEYSVVFVPFAWSRRDDWRKCRWRDLVFHEANDQAVLALGVGRDSFPALREDPERLAEEIRLLYVALTRARLRLYVAWADYREAKTSALACLLFGAGGVPDLPGQAGRLALLASGRPASIAVDASPAPGSGRLTAEAGEETLEARSFGRGSLHPSWSVTSYSRLVIGQERDEADPGEVAAVSVVEAVADGLPAGAPFGTALHVILEKCGAAERIDEEVARAALRRQGIDPAAAPRTVALLERVRRTPLGEGEPRLLDIPASRRLAELEFWFDLDDLRRERLEHLLGGRADLPAGFRERLAGLSFPAVSGFMKGFIDLVYEHQGRWYILDYKSNRLAGYGPEELEEAMVHSLYPLQYLLYAVALRRYLGWRIPGGDPDRLLGGVRYLFLRGMDPARPGSGVYRANLPADLVAGLDNLLGGRG